MANVYLDRLRHERRSINNSAAVGIKIAKSLGGMTRRMGGEDKGAGLVASLLIVEAITNLADTIQAIHEEGSDE